MHIFAKTFEAGWQGRPFHLSTSVSQTVRSRAVASIGWVSGCCLDPATARRRRAVRHVTLAAPTDRALPRFHRWNIDVLQAKFQQNF